MKTVTFIKDHPSGFKVGASRSLGDKHADRLVSEGYCTAGESDDSGAEDKEPEMIDYALTKRDIKNRTYPGISDDAKPGDIIQVPNPKYVPNV